MPDAVAIVTGYSSGLGHAFAAQLLTQGWKVVGVARNPQVQSDWPEGSPFPVHVSGSVASQDTAARAFRLAQEQGDLRLVINCAGQGAFGDVGTYSESDITKVLEGNLAGLMLFTDQAVRVMSSNGGDVVNVMSTAAKKLRTAETVYTAAKWGAKAYTRAVRDAVKAMKLPIRVFEVYPCGMQTKFWAQAVRPATDGSAFPSPEPIARAVLAGVLARDDSYQQEFTFERS